MSSIIDYVKSFHVRKRVPAGYSEPEGFYWHLVAGPITIDKYRLRFTFRHYESGLIKWYCNIQPVNFGWYCNIQPVNFGFELPTDIASIEKLAVYIISQHAMFELNSRVNELTAALLEHFNGVLPVSVDAPDDWASL